MKRCDIVPLRKTLKNGLVSFKDNILLQLLATDGEDGNELQLENVFKVCVVSRKNR